MKQSNLEIQILILKKYSKLLDTPTQLWNESYFKKAYKLYRQLSKYIGKNKALEAFKETKKHFDIKNENQKPKAEA